MPNFEKTGWYEQVGNNVYDLVYDQIMLREPLIACFEQRKITTFPLYEKNTEKVVT